MNIQDKLGITLKQLRNDSGYSQEKFALHIGMDRTYYASVEAGKRNVSLNNIKKIADGFCISISKLFALVEQTEISKNIKGETLNDKDLS